MILHTASVQLVATVAARLLARPILQEYDASTVDLGLNPAQFGKLAARYNLVEMAEAFRRNRDIHRRWSIP